MHSYRIVSSAAAVLFTILCLELLFTPDSIFDLLDIEGHASTIILGRRAAMLFLGMATMAWSSRHAEHSPGRTAVTRGMVVALLALAVLGTAEFISGNVGSGIFVAVAGEVAFVTGFVLAERRS
ncbi:MAG: hypothetical protein ACRBN8_18570 [Nannocystales bacterium]